MRYDFSTNEYVYTRVNGSVYRCKDSFPSIVQPFWQNDPKEFDLEKKITWDEIAPSLQELIIRKIKFSDLDDPLQNRIVKIETDIVNNYTNLNNRLLAEVQNRTNGDALLQEQVDSLKRRMTSAESRLTVLENRMDEAERQIYLIWIEIRKLWEEIYDIWGSDGKDNSHNITEIWKKIKKLEQDLEDLKETVDMGIQINVGNWRTTPSSEDGIFDVTQFINGFAPNGYGGWWNHGDWHVYRDFSVSATGVEPTETNYGTYSNVKGCGCSCYQRFNFSMPTGSNGDIYVVLPYPAPIPFYLDKTHSGNLAWPAFQTMITYNIRTNDVVTNRAETMLCFHVIGEGMAALSDVHRPSYFENNAWYGTSLQVVRIFTGPGSEGSRIDIEATFGTAFILIEDYDPTQYTPVPLRGPELRDKIKPGFKWDYTSPPGDILAGLTSGGLAPAQVKCLTDEEFTYFHHIYPSMDAIYQDWGLTYCYGPGKNAPRLDNW